MRVAEDVLALLLSVTWLDVIMDLQQVHRKWPNAAGKIRMDLYHLKLVGFEIIFENYRPRYTGSIESTAKIVLPF